jgi:cysteine protease ATG4
MSKTSSLKIAKVSDKITVLGRTFQVSQNSKLKDKERINIANREINDFVNNICWFSYRRGFKTMVFEVEDQKKITLNSDTGWGCMLRSGQMMLFQALQTINKDTLFEGGQTINQENRALELLLNLFAENHSGERSVFSISNVVETAYQHFNLQPGAWFRSTTIMMTVEKLNRLYPSP